MGSTTMLLALFFISLLTIVPIVQAAFTRVSITRSATRSVLISCISPSTTTLSAIQTLFDVKHLRTLLGTNSFPTSTSPRQSIAAKDKVIILFRRRCSNGTRTSNHRLVCAVQKGDGLYHIVAEVFARLVAYQEIRAVDDILDVSLIGVGSGLWIPVSYGCGEVNRSKTVHHEHVAEAGSSMGMIVEECDTYHETLLRLNGTASQIPRIFSRLTCRCDSGE